MRRTFLLAAVLGVVLSFATPASASPSGPPPPEDGDAGEPLPEDGTGTLAYEWNIAQPVSGFPPPNCTEVLYVGGEQKAQVCFQNYGDRIWVLDLDPDGLSATGVFHLNTGRQGACVNTLGSGRWGVCNKNFPETSEGEMYACNYETEDNTWHGCGTFKHFVAWNL